MNEPEPQVYDKLDEVKGNLKQAGEKVKVASKK